MKKVFIMTMIALFSFEVQAQTCTANPDCSALGYKYTASQCSNQGVKCPSGDVYYCSHPEDKCQLGYIYYADNTCEPYEKHNNSKLALGVVVHIFEGGKHGQILATKPVGSDGKSGRSKMKWVNWGDSATPNILGLPSFNLSDAQYYFESCKNTKIITAAGNASLYPAAWAAQKYAPTPETVGKWCLPAAGILTNLKNNMTQIRSAMEKFGENLPDNMWSSTGKASYDGYVWALNYADEYGLSNFGGHKTSEYYVYPVLEF